MKRSALVWRDGTQMQVDIELCGAQFVDEGCVRDGNMVSGPTLHDHHLYMKEFMAMLRESQQGGFRSVGSTQA